ncbi:c-type cytochrome domain-containing protein [Fibrisoma limi]|nr:c-type cytochrome domain-containing protein [Fibrisoma limi]
MNSLSILLQVNTSPSDWVLFFGHFHPLIVHLPIGFLIVAGILEAGRRMGKISVSDSAVTSVLFWSAVSATVACLFGYFLSLGGGYEQETLDSHMWQGIGVAVFAWIAWAVKSDYIGDRIPFGSALYLPALVVAIVLLGTAGHLGGSLTHGSDYLTQYTPEPFRTLAGIPPRQQEVAIKPITDVNQALVYEQIVNPILKTRCVQCHNAEKSKGDLRFDTAEMLKKGGENGPVFIAGKGTESELVKRCLLPEEDDHHMPPKGKTQLTEGQIALLTWWIDQGAPFDKKVSDLKVNDAIAPVLASLSSGAPVGSGSRVASSGPAPVSPVLTMKLPAPDPKAVEELKQTGLLVLPLSKEQHQLEVSAVNAKTFSDAQAALLPKLSQQIVWLKLGETAVTDATLAQVAKLKNLQKLHLEQTKVTDAGLKQLKGLPNLEYLNLYGTAITDAGLKELAELKSLKTVYLWQTNVTETALAELKKSLPNVEFVGGISEQAVAEFTKAGATEAQPDDPKKN